MQQTIDQTIAHGQFDPKYGPLATQDLMVYVLGKLRADANDWECYDDDAAGGQGEYSQDSQEALLKTDPLSFFKFQSYPTWDDMMRDYVDRLRNTCGDAM